MKLAIVINGGGGAGKDTLCEFAAKKFKTVNVSSIDPIKKIASENGWNGEKTPEARRFLSELKRIFTEYNDLPTKYIVEKYSDFLRSDAQLFFVHIREGEQIAHFIEEAKKIGPAPASLLVRSSRCSESYGNASDDDVENYPYDLIYQNDLPLEEAESDFIAFIEGVIGE
jgi:hypothetical protein